MGKLFVDGLKKVGVPNNPGERGIGFPGGKMNFESDPFELLGICSPLLTFGGVELPLLRVSVLGATEPVLLVST